MKTVLAIILLILWFLFIGETKITLHPFTISIECWQRPLGLILIFAGLGLYSSGEYTRGKLKGYTEGVNKCLNILNEKQSHDNEK